MSHTAKTPLDTLTELAREARDKAAIELGRDQRSEQQVVAQVEALAQYRDEYARRLQEAMREGMTTTRLYNYQQFMMSLDDAWCRAQQVLDEQRGRVRASREQWQQQQQRLSSYDTLAQRRASDVAAQQERRERRQHDEIAMQTVLRARRAHSEG